MALYQAAKEVYDNLYHEWLETYDEETLALLKETDRLCTVFLLNELGPKITNEVVIEESYYQMAA